jgi:hypothetical protein
MAPLIGTKSFRLKFLWSCSEWSAELNSKGSERTCIRSGLATFLHYAFTAHPYYVVEDATAQRKPPEVKIWTLRNRFGCFAPERKAVFDAIREELRRRNSMPILFDGEGPQTRDFPETISTLAVCGRRRHPTDFGQTRQSCGGAPSTIDRFMTRQSSTWYTAALADRARHSPSWHWYCECQA